MEQMLMLMFNVLSPQWVDFAANCASFLYQRTWISSWVLLRKAANTWHEIKFVWFILRPFQHDDGYIDGRSQIKVHTDERTQVHSARSSLTVTHPSSNRGRRNFNERATELALVATVSLIVIRQVTHWASLGRHRQPTRSSDRSRGSLVHYMQQPRCI